MGEKIELKDIKIPEKAHVRVEWKDRPENYSASAKRQIAASCANKYNIPKERVKVSYIAVKVNSKGEEITLGDQVIENIMDADFQQKLFKEYIENNGIEIDFNKILELDKIVNGQVTYNVEERNRHYSIKKLWVDNFLCFGNDVYVPFDELKGLICVNSTPQNMGGKTTLFIDSISFLLFGSTSKVETLAGLFNLFTDENKVSVKGLINIENVDYIIERIVTRKAKKAGGYTIGNTVKYYQLSSNGEEIELNEQDEDARKTTSKIKNTIGTESDFKLIASADSKTIEDIIDTKPTERSNIIHRFLGLEIIAKKEEIAKGLESAFKKSMISNVYNVPDLEANIQANENKINDNIASIKEKEETLEKTKDVITLLEKNKEDLIKSKKEIDENILKLDANSLQQEISRITESGKTKKTNLDKTKLDFNEFKDIVFDENEYKLLLERDKELAISLNNTKNGIGNNEKDINRYTSENNALKKAETCPILSIYCDSLKKGEGNNTVITENLAKIEKCKKDIKTLEEKIATINKEISDNNKKIADFNIIKEKVTKKNNLEILIPKIEVDLSNLRTQLREKLDKQKEYESNRDNIDLNMKIELDITNVNSRIKMETSYKEILIRDIQTLNLENKNLEEKNIENNNKIVKIKEELAKLKVYEIYSRLLGKQGIAKIVLKNSLPIINSEMNRVIDDMNVDFEIEMDIDDNNNIQFYLVRDGIPINIKSISGFERTASAILIRDVLAKISTIPKPNFMCMDEIWGKIGSEFFDSIRIVIDSVSKGYDNVFLISHDERIKEWCSKIVSIEKGKNNVSKLNIINKHGNN